MKAQPMRPTAKGLEPCEPAQATHVLLHCPGPYEHRLLPISRDHAAPERRGPVWHWDGDTERPTINPSILTTGGEGMPRCHSFVRDGRIQFLSDCDHELAGQTVDLLDIEP